MITAHIAGIPVEEWMLPLAASGGGVVMALRVSIRRSRVRRRRS